eukprot:CAMPEP_0206814156 /NCGR_PEP_ID=MMETSP0975-20121206/8638_1 /ASSEMBLY_ACC=CAM_ASM_000399 /TAXON_ID=483370 /ORGANISM="non described non described, Strain CCMP2097" /LENGTH=469 /DNA_ID=CAMNT_0054356321 /DNA_START=35 /DNA_END=1444 /DNA_ORIENTATION=+
MLWVVAGRLLSRGTALRCASGGPRSATHLLARPDTRPSSRSENWEPPRTDGGEAKERQPKRKMALLIGYHGKPYMGLQKQSVELNMATIESELEKALTLAGAVSEDNANDISKLGWSRAARTDKSVSAARTVVACRLQIEGGDVAKLIGKINDALPADIRVFDAVRVPKGFNAKMSANRRRYTYLLPTALLAPDDFVRQAFLEGIGMDADKLSAIQASIVAAKKGGTMRTAPWRLSDEEYGKVALHLAKYRAPASSLEQLRTFLQAFVGTRRYHNFTARMKSNDSKASRYILSFLADDAWPTLKAQDAEWVRLEVIGQSFILHQIRKMVAVASQAARNQRVPDAASANAMLDVLCRPGLEHPLQLVPGDGLYLGEPVFESYNTFKSSPSEGKARLEWLPDHPKFDTIEAFRSDVIEAGIVQSGRAEALAPFAKYLWQVLVFGFPLGPDEGGLLGDLPDEPDDGAGGDDE